MQQGKAFPPIPPTSAVPVQATLLRPRRNAPLLILAKTYMKTATAADGGPVIMKADAGPDGAEQDRRSRDTDGGRHGADGPACPFPH